MFNEEGTYTNIKGDYITREQAMKLGIIDTPEDFKNKCEQIGLTKKMIKKQSSLYPFN